MPLFTHQNPLHVGALAPFEPTRAIFRYFSYLFQSALTRAERFRGGFRGGFRFRFRGVSDLLPTQTSRTSNGPQS